MLLIKRYVTFYGEDLKEVIAITNKLLLGLVALIVVVGGALLLMNNSSKTSQPTVPQQPSTTVIAPGQKVMLTSSGFNPSIVTIKAGSTVTWVNNSGQQGTVNADDHPTHQKYPELNLGLFAPGSSLQVKLTKPGTYTYHNHLNPSQRGTIVVQ